MKERLAISFVVLIAMTVVRSADARVITRVCRYDPGVMSSVPVWIASSPLADGAKAFTDRDHVYRNVPAPLVGAEYIQMSNDDKSSPDFELRVTMAAAGTLYLILDNRIGTDSRDPAVSADPEAAQMHWVLQGGFTDTGLKVGLDEYADGWKKASERGPGEGSFRGGKSAGKGATAIDRRVVSGDGSRCRGQKGC